MKEITLLSLVILISASAAEAETRLVPSEQYPTIQSAIDACVGGDTVIVAPGTYAGDGNRDIDFGGRAITVRSIDPNDRDIVAATIIDCNGTEAEPHRGFYFHSDEDTNSDLAGLTITNGYASDDTASGFGPQDTGGGILCYRSSPTITRCVLSGNSARHAGGGISCYKATSHIDNCIAVYNSAGNGGGIYCYRSGTTIIDCKVINNKAAGRGGGISCMGYMGEDGLTIRDCIIAGNSGDGILLWDDILAIISNCTIKDNTAGSGIYVGGGCGCNGLLHILNCNITANAAQDSGGGIFLYYAGAVTISNCKITGCSATGVGGAIYTSDFSSFDITNCTISGNSASHAGGIYAGFPCLYGFGATITNSILRDNSPQQIIDRGYSATVSVACSNIQGGWPGEGNIDADPLFVDPGYWDPNGTPTDANDDFWVDGDYHLLCDSPCIHAGDPNYITEPDETDLDGNPRVIDGRIDMGAYEFGYIEAEMKFTPRTINCNSKGNWVKAHLVLPEGFLPEDVDVDTPALAEPMQIESEYVKVLGSNDGPVKVEVAFDREAFCYAVSDMDDGSLEVKVTGALTTGQYFSGTETIRIEDRRHK